MLTYLSRSPCEQLTCAAQVCSWVHVIREEHNDWMFMNAILSKMCARNTHPVHVLYTDDLRAYKL